MLVSCGISLIMHRIRFYTYGCSIWGCINETVYRKFDLKKNYEELLYYNAWSGCVLWNPLYFTCNTFKNSRMDQMMERRQKQQYLTSPRLSPILPVFFFLVVIRNLPELLCWQFCFPLKLKSSGKNQWRRMLLWCIARFC